MSVRCTNGTSYKQTPAESWHLFTTWETLILLKRSEELSFLFTEENWQRHGGVNYRVSHGRIYCHGESIGLTDEDLMDTGNNWNAWTRSTSFEGEKQ